MKLVNFELKKLFSTNLFKVMLLCVFAIVALYYAIIYMNSEKLMEQQALSDQNAISINQERIQEFKRLLDSDEVSDEEVTRLEHQIEMIRESNQEAQQRLNSYEEDDWNAVLKNYIEEDQRFLEQEQQFSESSINRSIFTLESHIEKNQLLLENEIQPILPVDYSTTIYDKFDSEKSQAAANKRAELYSPDALFFQKKLYSIVFGSVGLLFFMLLFAEIITKEGFRNGGAINLLYTQPISRWKVYTSKFFASLTIITLVLLGVILFSIVLGLTFDRFGDSNYPILIYGPEETYTFLDLDKYLIQSITLFVGLLIFSISLYFLISIIFRHTVTSIGLILVVFLMGIGISEQPFFLSMNHWNPFSYSPVESAITKEKAVITQNWSITYEHGVLTLLLSTLIIWLLIFVYLATSRKAG